MHRATHLVHAIGQLLYQQLAVELAAPGGVHVLYQAIGCCPARDDRDRHPLGDRHVGSAAGLWLLALILSLHTGTFEDTARGL